MLQEINIQEVQSNLEMEQDLIEYNTMLSAHRLFKKTFELERQKIKMALNSSIKDALSKLPRDV